MQVSRLEVFGFKSFMDRLILPVEEGITGVVGPNGCGKSNIVDALRWVLGETKARNLRGGVLEDVIFNGTDSLRPLGLAEVTLTLRPSGESFLDDLVSSSSELKLDGELQKASSEVAQVTKEARHLAESAAESDQDESVDEEEEGGQRPHLRVVAGKALAEREREILESEDEAEELSAAEEENLPPAEETEQQAGDENALLLSKYSWLKSAAEVQITRRLYRSGESEFFLNRVPCRLRDVKEFLRAAGISARSYTIVAQGEVARIVTAKPEDRRLVLEEAAGVVGFRDKVRAAERRLEETEINISRIEDIFQEVKRQVGSLKRQADRARNREMLESELREAEEAIFLTRKQEIEERLAAFREEKEGLSTDISAAEKLLSEQTGREGGLRDDLVQVETTIDQLRAEADSLRDDVLQYSQKRGEAEAKQSELAKLKEAVLAEKSRLEDRSNTLLQREEEGESKVTSLRDDIQLLTEQVESLVSSADTTVFEANERVESLRRDLSQHDSHLKEVRAHYSKEVERLRELEGELRALSGSQGEERESPVPDGAERLFLHLDFPGEYSKALQAVLGDTANAYVVSELESSLHRFLELESSASFDLVYARPQIGEESQRRDEKGRALLDLVQVPESLKGLCHTLLKDVFLVDSVDEAREAHRSGSTATFVTREGVVKGPDRFRFLHQERGLFEVKEELTAVQERFEEAAGQLVESQQRSESLRMQLAGEEQALKEALAARQEREIEIREKNSELGSLRGSLQAVENLIEQCRQECVQNQRTVEELDSRLQQMEAQLEQVQSELSSFSQQELESKEGRIEELRDEIIKLEGHREELRSELNTGSTQTADERGKLDRLRQRLGTLELELQKAELGQGHLEESFLERYGQEELQSLLARSSSFAPLAGEELQQAESDAQRLRARLVREGSVDPDSIERYEVESARLEDLGTQKEDLRLAAQTLRRTIEHLRTTSVARFEHTFELVRDRFETLMPRLFGGGKATLELLDAEDPLQSGVEIIVRPPGKKPKSLELLSGGEKALCATALIVSMFLVRPSPLCVLDEVDAPLDDANLVRFLSLVKEMSAETQFLLITHNKASMSAADRLVGVTMETPGASKVITVSLEEAYQQVA